MTDAIRCNCACGQKIHPRTRFRHFRKLSNEAAADAATPDDGELDALEAQTNSNEPEGDIDMGSEGSHEPHLAETTDDIEMDDGENAGLQATYDGTPNYYASNYAGSDAASSQGSWYDVGTPPPSPPPLPNSYFSDNSDPEDEDGYQRITAQDYQDYDRWFAEDSQAELDEMIAETLTKEELDSIKMTAIRLFGHISQRNYERIRFSFREKCIGTRIAALSGVSLLEIDCCINVCHAFTKQYENETACSKCGQPRYDYNGKARQVYQYIPTIPRFQAFFNNPTLIEKLSYRHNYPQNDGEMDNFFDSDMYKNLCRRNIVIDSEDTGARFFSGRYDIATSILSDGVQIFKHASRENATCWPIILQILNLPPADRVQLRNLLVLSIIPGPNKPSDFDSYLVPFVDECLVLARGVETYNALTRELFLLLHHPLIVCGDMQAIKFYEQMKGPNAVVPCRGCLSVGVYQERQRTYYIPLAAPLDPKKPSATTESYDPLNLPLRTERNLTSQLRQMERAQTTREYDELAKKYGISGPSILDRIPSIQRPTSYPHEFLHLFLLNHGPNLVALWTNSYSGISDTGSENYLISRTDWAAIGRETEAATNLLPSAFIRPLPNIESTRRLYCGESWSFWLIYIGPIVLRGRLAAKYYNHYLELVSILKCLLEVNNSTRRIKQLRKEIAGYIERFEEYYYQYNSDRLCVCKLTLHALLHVADDVLRCGPTWVSWSFSIERYCREVTACAQSKVVPYSSISKHVLQMAQLSTIAARFPEIRKALLFGKADAPVDKSRMECIYPQYPHTVLRVPCLRGFPLATNVRRRLAAYFRTNRPQRTFQQWLGFIPERCERWGKVRIAGGGDCIRSAVATNPLSTYGKRDSSFVRFTYYKDKNERYRNLPVEMVPAVGYGRLDFILALVLPADPLFDIHEPETHILAHLTEAKDADGDAAIELVSYTQLGRSFVLDITAVEHVVGRVETRGVKASGEWVIVDRSDSLCETVFHQPEVDFEDE